MSKFEEYIKAREEIVNKLEGYFNGKEHIVLCSLYYCNNKHYPYSEIEENGVTKYQEGCLMYNYVLAYLGYTFITEKKEIPMEAGLKYSKAASYIKVNSELISQIEASGPLENGKEGNVIEYMLAVYPGLREQMVSVFGSEIITEQRFPIREKIEYELARVKQIGESILARKKIESLTDEEVREKYLANVTASIDSRIASCEREIAENLVLSDGFTPENPRYKMLEEKIAELKVEKEAKEAEYTDMKTSEMREELLCAYTDYEEEYNTYKKAEATKENLPTGTTISDELKSAKEKLEQRKAALAEATKREASNHTNEKILAALEELMASDEWKTYFSDSQEVQVKWANVLESMDRLHITDVKISSMTEAEEKYEKLGFFAKKGEEGRKLKQQFTPEKKEEVTKEKDTETDTLHHNQEEHSKAKEKLAESVAALKEKINSLGLPGLGYFEGVAFISPDKLATYYQELQAQCKASIASNNISMHALNDQENATVYSEALSEKAELERSRVEELNVALNVESTIETKGQAYYDTIETAVELLNDAESYGTDAATETPTKSK